MTRVRTNNVFGTITDNPLTNSATTMNSAGLANLAVVSSAEAIIILDPNRVAGAPEIVVVTAHTGSATSATIQRGQFGTSARQHAQGTEWVHGPITTNATSYATAADDQGDYVPMNAWESWTPVWSNLTVGSGTQVATFIRIGRTIHFQLQLTLNSTTVGSGPSFTGLPTPAQNKLSFFTKYLDSGTAHHLGATDWLSSAFRLRVNGGGNPTSSSPFTWANGDEIHVEGTYEAAS